MGRLEKYIESDIVDYVENEEQGEAYKLIIEGRRGFPDRTFLLPGGIALFPETKTTDGEASEHQRRKMARLRELGFVSEICRSVATARELCARARAKAIYDRGL